MIVLHNGIEIPGTHFQDQNSLNNDWTIVAELQIAV
jgi:hypothetical protein